MPAACLFVKNITRVKNVSGVRREVRPLDEAEGIVVG